MSIGYIHTVSSLFDNLFLGFGLFVVFTSIFKLLVKNELSFRISNAQEYAYNLIRYIGIVLFCYSIIVWIYVYLINENNFFTDRATGPYKQAYYAMAFRPMFLALLAQLLWVKRIKKTKWTRILLTIMIFIVALVSGRNFERFVIVVTSLHRDYLPSSWESLNEGRLLIAFGVLWYFLKSTLIFTGVLLVYWFFKNRSNESIHTA